MPMLVRVMRASLDARRTPGPIRSRKVPQHHVEDQKEDHQQDVQAGHAQLMAESDGRGIPARPSEPPVRPDIWVMTSGITTAMNKLVKAKYQDPTLSPGLAARSPTTAATRAAGPAAAQKLK